MMTGTEKSMPDGGSMFKDQFSHPFMVQTSFNQPKVTQESSIESIVTKYD